jgi:putative ABC transport system substrate-binding protein
MRRREFIRLVGGAAAAWPLSARAQQPAIPVIGFMSSRSPAESESVVAAFRRGLAERGFVEGHNVSIAFRWADGRYERLPTLAAELVDLRVDLLFAAGGTPSAVAAKAATSAIPVVFAGVGDPLRAGLVASLARPSGNVTGMSVLTTSLGAKRLEILNEMITTPAGFAYLANPINPFVEIELKETVEAASARGITLKIVYAGSDDELNALFESLRTGGLVVATDPFFDSRRDRLVALAARHAVPAIYAWREYVAAGGLMSYGTSITDSYRQAAIYAGRILNGEKPTDLPVMQPTKFEMVINLKTAKALGFDVAPQLLVRADEVIE